MTVGLLGDIGNAVVKAVTDTGEFTVDLGNEILKGTFDFARQIVKIGEDVYRAAPPELFALAGDPLHGLLKHVAEDELILLGHVGLDAAIFTGLTWPLLGPVGASLAIAKGAVPLYVAAGSLVGKFDQRHLNDEEWEMATYVFRDTLFPRDEIILTNVGGLDGRPFVFPIGPLGPVLVNLGNKYVHDSTIPDGPLLLHELTHVWQAKVKVLTEVFLYDALNREYDFTAGSQWRTYGLEQQAGIVEAWSLGAVERKSGASPRFPLVHNELTMNSPLFRYINGNVRRSASAARTGDGRSVKRLLAEGRHRSVRAMHPAPPRPWWS